MGPTAGAVLAEWGADVIKVEQPATGDPVRHLRPRPGVAQEAAVNTNLHHANRGKRSVGIDLSTEDGHSLLMKLAAQSDVFLTNYLPRVRTKLAIDVEDIRRANPTIVYARSSARGPRGPEADLGGYDFATFWCRAGLADVLHSSELRYPPVMPSGGMGDMTAGAVLAGAISAALLQREREGTSPVVDVSLLATGAWMMGLNVAAAAGAHPLRLHSQEDRDHPPNPLVNVFRTADDRFVALCLLQSDEAWPELCLRMDRPDLLADERFADHDALIRHSAELTAILDSVFRTATLAEWRQRLHRTKAVWEVVQDLPEVATDVQMVANDYIQPVPGSESVAGAPSHLVSAPAQFDERSGPVSPAPELGQDTEHVLLALGYQWEDILQLKEQKVIT
jgi:crotonobetainyl-CoA:carnitine CoA-transferase CaiB-like acyl-CoA transferase